MLGFVLLFGHAPSDADKTRPQLLPQGLDFTGSFALAKQFELRDWRTESVGSLGERKCYPQFLRTLF